MKLLVFVFCALLFGLSQFQQSFKEAERYGYMADIMPADWGATNLWLDSTDCAVERGVWLAICEKGKLVALSEYAVADDPGHAFLLDLSAMTNHRRATLPDVARLNTLLDTVGLLALAGVLFAVRAWLTSIVLLWLGPIEYLGWMTTSPHWAFIGMVSLCGVLPIALAAKELGVMSRRSGNWWIAAGVIFLALATLIREAVGLMGIAVTFGTAALLVVRALFTSPGLTGRHVGGLLLVVLLASAAFMAPKWVVLARDLAFDMQKGQLVVTHGLSHTLYLGLGFVENKWGILYYDYYGQAVAAEIDPSIVFCSPEYFQLMWKLYIGRWIEDPAEVMRIYALKGWELLARPTMYPGPPFGIVLLIGLTHLLVTTALGAWHRIGFVQGQLIETVALAFAGLFLAQGMMALPSHNYAMPVNAYILVLLGVIVEFFVRALLRIRRAA
ncbi:hypothetical protein BH11PSE3_BH11PSE3_35870 [soil metagenome]